MRGKSTSSEEHLELNRHKCRNCALRKSKTNYNSLEDVNSLVLLKELRARGADVEAGKYLKRLKDQISSLGTSKQYSSAESEKPRQLNFGFFLMSNGSEENLSVYDSSMTHRLLDALLDDKIKTGEKWTDKPEEFSKTTDPRTADLKDFLGVKSNRELNKSEELRERSKDRASLGEEAILDLNDVSENGSMENQLTGRGKSDVELRDLIHIPTDEEVSQFMQDSQGNSQNRGTEKIISEIDNGASDLESGEGSVEEDASSKSDFKLDNSEQNEKEEENSDQESLKSSPDSNLDSEDETEKAIQPRIRITAPDIEIEALDIGNFKTNDPKKKNPFLATDGSIKKKNSENILESEVIAGGTGDTMNSQTLMESFRRRKQTRLNSYVSKRSVSNGPEDWRHRLGEMIGQSKHGSVLEHTPKNKNSRGRGSKMLLRGRKRRMLSTGGKSVPPHGRIPSPRKMMRNTLKSLVFETGKKDKQMLKQKLERNRLGNSYTSRSSHLESVNETISQIMDYARRTVLLEEAQLVSLEVSRPGSQENLIGPKVSRETLEREGVKRTIEEMSRQKLEDRMVTLCQELMEQGLDWKNVEGSFRTKLETGLKQMKKAVEKPFEKLVEKHVGGLEEMKNILDHVKMENIQLEYGMIKLSEAYNQIINSLQMRGIRLEVPREEEEDALDSSHPNLYSEENNDDVLLENQENKEELLLSNDKNILTTRENETDLEQEKKSDKSEEKNMLTPKRTEEALDLGSAEVIPVSRSQSKKTANQSSKRSNEQGSNKRFFEEFSLTEFRDEIRQRVQFEKSKLDSHLREITEGSEMIDFQGLGIDSKADTVTSRVVLEDSNESAGEILCQRT